MVLKAGMRLGPYEIVAPIGAGGMGEVYRATDTRLDRSVAVKMLPAELADDAQLRLRFEREAKTISQLNHPNICTLFDVGENYLVMELLEGETLADRIARGALPIAETLRFGAQIAEALDRAHRAGITHRDLKPSNIMLTRSGAKLLDFGLAKSATASINIDGPTQHKSLTREGTIIGTFQYMAPEQLEGEEADARTDIFALGAVLYEMATGRRAFEGTSKTSLIAAIVSAEPKPVSQVLPLTPPALDHVIQKCLSKGREDRWQSAHDVAEELRWIGEAGSSAGVAAPLLRKRKSVERIGWIAVLALAIAAAAFFALRKGPLPPRIESAIVPPDGVALSYLAGSLALSTDGRQLAFIGRAADGKSMIWLRSLGSSSARPLAGTEDGQFPFCSADGKYVGFLAQDKLYKISVDGGSPEMLASAPNFLGGTWNRSGDIVFSAAARLNRVSAAGGAVEVLIPQSNRILSAPHFLPDGDRFLFTSIRGISQPDALYVSSLKNHGEKRVLAGVYSNVAYAAPGFILYSRDGDLRAQRVDPKSLAPSGDPIRLADQVQYDADSRKALFAVSDSGSLIYLTGQGAGKSQLTWVGRDGKEISVLAPPAMFYSPRISHDGKRVAVDLSEQQTAAGDVWIFDLAHGVSSRVTYDAANESSPTWMPGDRKILFFSEKAGQLDLYFHASNSTGSDELLFADATAKLPFDISPDGKWLVYFVADQKKSDTDVAVMDLTTRKTTTLFATPFSELAVQFSPDGKWISYQSNESGQDEIYVQRFPDGSSKSIVSKAGGRQPAWSADSRQIYYVAPDRKLMSVPITLGESIDAGTPVALFDAHVRNGPTRQYEVTPDGSRFLLNRMVGEEGSHPVTLVQNWQSALVK